MQLAARVPRIWTALCAMALVGCSSAGSTPGKPLGHGDAPWDRPPFDPPGGDGTDPGGGWGEDGGSGGDPGGTSGLTGDSDSWGSSGTTDPGPYTCEPWAGEPTTTTGSTEGSTSTDSEGSSTGGTVQGCDRNPGVCEPSAMQDTDAVPCCEDPDCACDTSDCAQAPCSADGYCDCLCTADPDCAVDQCASPIQTAPGVATALQCPDSSEPLVLYMSNDDSNSQASPVIARRAILDGQIVSPFQIRIHEFLNYYDLSYANPDDKPAAVGMQMRRIDAQAGEFVLLVNAQGRALTNADRRAMNLVFALDTSGSMAGEPIELLKESMRAIAASLKAGDVVSVVTWDTAQVVPLESHTVQGPNDPTLLAVVDAVDANGGTDLHAGLVKGYELAQANYSPERINRLVLISDGGANAGVTDIDIIADAASDSDGEGIYLVGVGVGNVSSYRDDLMDDVTDAGKGAYVFVDSKDEAHRLFEDHFIQVMEVSARNVQLQLTLPWYFGVKEFHGEEYSEDPAEVDPQHLAPGYAMSYHQIIAACDPAQIYETDPIKAKLTYEHPLTREPMEDELEVAIGTLVQQDANALYKADVIVGYAQSLIVIGDLVNKGDHAGAKAIADAMVTWLSTAADALQDGELVEMRDLMQLYAGNL